jgi:Nucleotide modification associated domain 1
MSKTDQQFDQVTAVCRTLFIKKMKDYGASWRILRQQSVTDQIFIKANRIRSIEIKGVSKVDEGIRSELIGIVNYGIIGLIQLDLGFSDTDDLHFDTGMELYDKFLAEAKNLMMAKNHDYDEAWRSMRIQSFTDLILTKILRTKQIEDNLGKTLASEGVDANYFDMINYAVFGLIKLQETETI